MRSVINKFDILISFDIDIIEQMNLSQSLLANIAVVLIVLICLIFAIRIKKTYLIYFIIVFSAIDLITMAQMNSSGTIHSKTKVSDLKNELKGLPEGFPIPENIPMNNQETFEYELPSIEHNKSVFRKQPSYFGNNSFGYSDYTYLNEYVASDIKHAITANKLIYCPDGIFEFREPFKLNVTNYAVADKMNFTVKKFDNNKSAEIVITDFKPNSIIFNCNSTTNDFIVFMQNYFTGWKAYVNNKEIEIHKVNFCMMGIDIPKGNNVIEFKYEPKKIIISMWISLFSFILTLILIFILRKRDISHF